MVPAGGGYTGIVDVLRQVWPQVPRRDQELVARSRARETLTTPEAARVGPLVMLGDGPDPGEFAGMGIPPLFRIQPAPRHPNASIHLPLPPGRAGDSAAMCRR